MKKKLIKKVIHADSLEVTRLRRSAGLDQPQLAGILKRGVKTISNWENSEKPLKAGTVEYVARGCLEYVKRTRGEDADLSQNKPSQGVKQPSEDNGENTPEEVLDYAHKSAISSEPFKIADLEAKLDDKQKIIDLLEAENTRLKQDIAFLKQRADESNLGK